MYKKPDVINQATTNENKASAFWENKKLATAQPTSRPAADSTNLTDNVCRDGGGLSVTSSVMTLKANIQVQLFKKSFIIPRE